MTNIIKKLVKDLEKNEGITLGNDVLPYVEKAIQQAIAEERERVVGIIESMYQRFKMQLPSHSVANIRGSEVMFKIERDEDAKSIHIAQNSRTDGYNQALANLLSSLDKPLTDKE